MKIAVVLGLLLFLCAPAPAGAQAQPPAKPTVWKVQSQWPAGEPLHASNVRLARRVEELSGGRLKFEPLPVGALVPGFEVLDAVHRGVLDAALSWPGFWAGKNLAVALFTGVPGGPFGMQLEEFVGWLIWGGGRDLYNEILQKELKMDVVALMPASIVPWEAFGWFPKPIRTVDDLKGLKFRAPGLPGEVFKEMGMTVVTIAPGEIVPALERGVIDATEYSSPYFDLRAGLPAVRKYYHLPGFHQPISPLEFLINKKRWNELSPDLQAIVRAAVFQEAFEFPLEMIDAGAKALEEMVTRHKVTVVTTPREVLEEQLRAFDRVVERKAKENPLFAKVVESQRAWAKRVVPYHRLVKIDFSLAADHYWKK